MKTKLEIIQSLLDERKITAAEAMVLMEKDYVYIPSYPYIPYNPYPYYGMPGTYSDSTKLIVSSN